MKYEPSFCPFNTFRYWFEPVNAVTYDVIQVNCSDKQNNKIGQLIFNDEEFNVEVELSSTLSDVITPEELTIIKDNFWNFKSNRPEGLVGSKTPFMDQSTSIEDVSVNTMVDFFETIMLGCYNYRIFRYGKDPDTFYSNFESILNWIRNTDFYTCPASTVYHDSSPSGLLYHTLKVYNNAMDVHQLDKFSKSDIVSIAICALCHDFTKINNYEQFMRNVKNEQTGEWEQVPSYRRKGTGIPLGHGVASAYVANSFFKLSLEEWLAIRWHMGEYMCTNGESSELQDSIDNYPLVLLIQFADRLACVNY